MKGVTEKAALERATAEKLPTGQLGLPITRQTNAEQVVERLLGLIRAGVLQPGQQLPSERELASSLGVSRPTLREALRALSLMGALNIRQGGGVFVSALTSEDLLSPLDFYFSLDAQHLERLFEAQLVLETEVARMAAQRMTDEVIDKLEICLRETEPILNAQLAWFEMDTRFHLLIAQATGNLFLERVVSSIRTMINLSREATVRSWSVPRSSHEEHFKVLDALKAHDADGAAAAMHAHLARVHAAHAAYKQAAQLDGQTKSEAAVSKPALSKSSKKGSA